MTVIENRCRGCAVPGYPCTAPYCDFFRTVVHYCDVCGEECEGDVCEACEKRRLSLLLLASGSA